MWFTKLHFTPFPIGWIGRLILPSHFGVLPSINPVPAGLAFSLTVQGLDPSNQLAENYRGSVHFTSSDGAATLPADYTFTAADNGAHTFSVTLPTAGRQTITVTDTVQGDLTGTVSNINEFVLAAGSGPWGITAGPDGNLWFAEVSANKIVRRTPDGVFTEFPLGANTGPRDMTAGPDGNIWFNEISANKIARITPDGAVMEFAVPTPASDLVGITPGPDGNLWFTEQTGNKIGRITLAGVVTEFQVPTANSQPLGITAGPDGNLWFTEYTGNKIGRITPSGVINELPRSFSQPSYITVGADGNLWFAENGANKIWRMTTGGIGTAFPIPTPGSGPRGITLGRDGNVWFTEFFSHQIGRITPTGLIAEFSTPTTTSGPRSIAAGPDGNIWFTDSNTHKLDRLNTAIDVTPAAPDHFSLSAPGTVTSGAPFDLTVTVQDAFNNTVTGYTGTAHFTSADPYGATLPADYQFTASDAGVHTFPAGATLYTAGSWNVTAADTASGIQGSALVNVMAAPAVSFAIAAPSTIPSGTPFDVTVTALDPYGNRDTNYTGTVTWTTTDPDAGVVLPPAYTFQSSDAGQVTFPGGVTLITSGNQTITATDTVSGITGSALVTVTGPTDRLDNDGSRLNSLVISFAAVPVELIAGPSAGLLVDGDHGIGIRGPTACGTESGLRSLSAGSNDSAGSREAPLPTPLPYAVDSFVSRLTSRIAKRPAVAMANDTTAEFAT
jgi:streptogramin lyase